MTLKLKIIISFIILCVFLIMFFIIKQQNDTIRALKTITDNQQNQQKYIEDNIVKIKSTLLSKDEFQNKLNELQFDISSLNKDIKSIGAKTDGIISLQANTIGIIKNNQNSSSTTPTNNTEELSCKEDGCYKDKYNYFKFKQNLDLKEENIPIGTVTFDATSKNPWSYSIYSRLYNTSIVLAYDKLGNKTAYAKMSIKANDKVYDLKQTKIQYYEQLPENEFTFYNPRLMAGLNGGINFGDKYSIIPNIQLFISSYGKLIYNPKFSILGFGFGYDVVNQTVPVLFTPFVYRLFDDSNLFQNIHIGPSISSDIHGNIAISMQFGLGL